MKKIMIFLAFIGFLNAWELKTKLCVTKCIDSERQYHYQDYSRLSIEKCMDRCEEKFKDGEKNAYKYEGRMGQKARGINTNVVKVTILDGYVKVKGIKRALDKKTYFVDKQKRRSFVLKDHTDSYEQPLSLVLTRDDELYMAFNKEDEPIKFKENSAWIKGDIQKFDKIKYDNKDQIFDLRLLIQY